MAGGTVRTSCRRSVCLLALALGIVFLPASVQGRDGGGIDLVELQGVIDPVSSRFLVRQVDEAAGRNSHLLIVRLDTPGGLDVSMREMVRKLLNSPVPVVVWVAPSGARAGSAGVFITYAAHVAAMSPGTNIGAAHPVDLTGGSEGVAAEKATNDAAAYLRSIARQRGRNVDWAEKAVRESASLEADEAVSQNVVDLIAADRKELLEKLHGRQVEVPGRRVTLSTRDRRVVTHEMPFLDQILHSVVRPEIAYFLLLLGFYGLLFELYSPGLGLGGVLGGVSLILAFYSLSVLPVSWAGLALILLGIALFAADLFVAGVGVLTVGGTVALVAGSLLLFSDAEPVLRLSPLTIAAATGLTLLFFVSLLAAALRARTSKPLSGPEAVVGMQGKARSTLSPAGQVMVKGAVWEAVSGSGPIPEGAAVRVLEVDGLRLIVEQAESPVAVVGNGEQRPAANG